MEREPHFLRPTIGGTAGQLILSVGVSSTRCTNSASDRWGTHRLEAWHVVSVNPLGPKDTKPKRFKGVTADEFWTVLHRICGARSYLRAVFLPASDALHLLRFWERFEHGVALLNGVDGRCGQEPSKNVSNVRRGFAVLEDTPTIVQFRVAGTQCACIAVDARNYGVSCPDQLCEWVGLGPPLRPDRLAGPRDHAAKAEHEALAISQFMSGYCQMVENLSLCRVANTISSQAWSAFKAHGITEPMYVHDNAAALELEHAAYYSGRCEVFRVGAVDGPVYHLDIKSCYPSLCRANTLPVRFCEYIDNPRELDVCGLIDAYHVIAEVSIDTDKPWYPKRLNKSLCFPVGRFRTTLCGPELTTAVVNGHAIKVHRCATYEGGKALEYFYQQWQQWLDACDSKAYNGAWRVLKRFGNCLPGKFAQRWGQWVDWPECEADAPFQQWTHRTQSGEVFRARAIGWQVQREEAWPDGPESMPAVAAWITSLGRAKLLDCLRVCGRYDLYYCDTDSIFCGGNGYRNLVKAGLVGSGEPGKLQMHPTGDRAVFHAAKHYQIDDEIVWAGNPKLVDRVDADGYHTLIRRRIRSYLTHQQTPMCQTYLMKARNARSQPRGVVAPNGTVSPLTLKEW